MVQKSHFGAQTSGSVPPLPPSNIRKLFKINDLVYNDLSPLLSPVFPCTSHSRPDPTDRRFRLIQLCAGSILRFKIGAVFVFGMGHGGSWTGLELVQNGNRAGPRVCLGFS